MIGRQHYAGVRARLVGRVSALMGLVLFIAPEAQSEEMAARGESEGLTLTARTSLYYTNDVALFSATRRMSLNADPTQPAIDQFLVGQGADGVYEPTLEISKAWSSDYGKTKLQMKGDGYVFMEKTAFTHGTMQAGISQEFDETNALHLSYYLSPDLYLGKNIDRQPQYGGGIPSAVGGLVLAPEQLSSQIGVLRYDFRLNEAIEIQWLARVGERRYDPQFSERNLTFWTIGPHLETHLTPTLSWVVGYHFERGIAAGHQSSTVQDDVSYDNNFISTEFEWMVAPKDTLSLGLHYELNYWLSNSPQDDRYKTSESTYQADLVLKHQIDSDFLVYGGTQYGYRVLSPDGAMTSIFNLSMGVQSRF